MLRMKYTRQEKQLSQFTLGVLAQSEGGLHRKIDRQDIALIETGRLLPTVPQLQAIARVLGVEPASKLLEPLDIVVQAAS
jgi:transcriptional regulator with XRE-family HTH domain